MDTVLVAASAAKTGDAANAVQTAPRRPNGLREVMRIAFLRKSSIVRV
jgi:hypothetical protein